MPKNKKKQEAGEEKGGKLLTLIVILVILLLWLAIFAVLIKLDIGGLGTMLRPSLKDVPLLNTLLPEVSMEQQIWEENYQFSSMEDAIAEVEKLRAQLEEARSGTEDYQKKIAELQAEVDRLKVFEDDVLNAIFVLQADIVFLLYLD